MINNALLALRPTNVMHQLGAHSLVPLYNGRDLLRSLANSMRVLWMPQLPHKQAAVGVFRAAVHRKSVVAFSLDLSDQEAKGIRHQTHPTGFVSFALWAAKQFEEVPPFALHLQAPAMLDEKTEIHEIRDLIADCVQAGFTSFGIDLKNIEPEAVAPTAQILSEPIASLELAFSVVLPLPQPMLENQSIDKLARTICDQVDSLRKAQSLPDLLILPSPTDWTEQAWQLAYELAPQLAPTQLAWREYSHAQGQQPNPSQANIRAIVSDPLLLRTWPGGPDPTNDPDRTEALAYSASLTRIDRLGSRNSVEDFVQHLVSQCA